MSGPKQMPPEVNDELLSKIYAKQVGDHAGRAVLLALADDYRGGPLFFYPDIDRLAWKTERSERNVKRGLDSLYAKRVLTKVRFAGFTGCKLHLDRLPDKPGRSTR